MKAPATVLTIVLAGCVTTQATMMNTTAVYAPICSDAVQIYSAAERIAGPYEEVAVINSSGAHDMTNEQQMLTSMRKKAAEVGANGVILGAIQEPGGGAKVAGALFGVSVDRKGSAIAVYVPSDTARVTEVCNATRTFVDKSGNTWTAREVVTPSNKRALQFHHENGRDIKHISPAPDNWRTISEKALFDLWDYTARDGVGK